MHTNVGIRPSVTSLATNIQGWIRPFASRVQQWITSMAKKAKKAMVFDLSAKWSPHASACRGTCGSHSLWMLVEQHQCGTVRLLCLVFPGRYLQHSAADCCGPSFGTRLHDR